MWRVAQVAGQTAAPLRAPAAAAGEGSAGAGGAGVLAHRAVTGHLALGVSIAGDDRAGVPALVTKNILYRIFSGLDRCPADMLIPFAGMNGQDFCLDSTGMAALKADVIKQGRVEPRRACSQGNSSCRNNMLTPGCREQSQKSFSCSCSATC